MNLMLLDWAYSKTGNKTYLNVMKNSTSTLIKNHAKNNGAFGKTLISIQTDGD